MNRQKVYLWFSHDDARDGKVYHVPQEEGKEPVKCTAITTDPTPPTESSKFLQATFLA